MRNYSRRYNTTATKKSDAVPDRSRTKVIIDKNTIYEIDLDCYECRMNEEAENEKTEGRELR